MNVLEHYILKKQVEDEHHMAYMYAQSDAGAVAYDLAKELTVLLASEIFVDDEDDFEVAVQGEEIYVKTKLDLTFEEEIMDIMESIGLNWYQTTAISRVGSEGFWLEMVFLLGTVKSQCCLCRGSKC